MITYSIYIIIGIGGNKVVKEKAFRITGLIETLVIRIISLIRWTLILINQIK